MRTPVRAAKAAPLLLEIVVVVVGLLLILPNTASGQTECQPCHAELELLRQHVETLDEARALRVSAATVDSSAHTGMTCSECHTGYRRFPHPDATAPTPPTTATCASCHEAADTAWLAGIHATDDNADCASCHGVHDMRSVERLQTPTGIAEMQAACADCHFEPILPSTDPHADSVSCADCHEPHATLPASDPDASVHVLNQWRTCGDCHDSISAEWIEDSHSEAVPGLVIPGAAPPDGATSSAPPACTACHGSHGMLAPSAERFELDMVNRCSACHTDYAETFFGTYHGKATALGSEIAATCDQCHGSHVIHPVDDVRSAIHEANVQETCGVCHDNVRPAFVEYDSHPNPMDRSRNAPLFYSFVFMNALLFGVVGIFVLHTVLWWVRLLIDQRRGVHHGIGEHHG